MDLYILDTLFRRNEVVDTFESLIWTDRWNSFGDFELEIRSNLENRSRFVEGVYLGMNNSDRVMKVESIEDKINDDGKEVLDVKGRSLELILEDRVVRESMISSDPWYLSERALDIPRILFDHVCSPPPALHADDVIPFLEQRYPDPEIEIDEDDIEWIQERPNTLYNEIRAICSTFDLGFRIVREGDTLPLYFEVYTGRDRTTRQTDEPPVIFTVNLENLSSTTEFRSTIEAKNVAHVFTEDASALVYADDVDPEDAQGIDRRILLVNASIPSDHPNPAAALIEAGKEALKNHRHVSIFEGELKHRESYTYGVDYLLGDLVEMRNRDGVISYKHVTEQIFVDDGTGEHSYPTLSVGRFAPPNTWLSYVNKSTAWEDFDDEVWSDM